MSSTVIPALDADLLNHAKIGVMVGSLISAVAGMTVLLIFSRRPAGANVECQME